MFKIAFIYNTVPDAMRCGVYAECASQKTIMAIQEALVQGGNEIIPINLGSPEQLQEIIAENRPDFAFVTAEGFLDTPETLYDGSGSTLVRQALANLGVPASHSSVKAMELCRHKDLTYIQLEKHLVSCPWYIQLSTDKQVEDIPTQRFPLFVKPAGGGNSVGIDAGSVVYSMEQLNVRLEQLFNQLGAISLVAETFLPETEYTVGVVGNGEPMVLPPVAFPKNLVRSGEVKKLEARGEIPVEIVDHQDPLYYRLRELALQTFSALDCSDVIRIDIKTGEDGNLYVIDVNGTPSLSPTASMPRMAEAIGLDYYQLVNLVLFSGMQRAGIAAAPPEFVLQAQERLRVLGVQEQVA